MIKRITKTKQMRLDELIKYVWDNDGSLFEETETIRFFTEDNKRVTFDDTGYFETYNWFDPEDLFPVETEEEITEDTEFEQGVVVLKYGTIITFSKSNFEYLKQKYAGQQFKIYALIDGELELIYKGEN